MKIPIAIVALAVVFGGCADQPTSSPGPYVKPSLVMIPVDQLGYYHHEAKDPTSAENEHVAKGRTADVETNSPVTAIQINRYPDPDRPDELMHEAHIIYRREAPPRWRLQPASTDEQILIGPQIADGRGEIKPVESQELESFLHDQRASVAQERELMTKLSESLRALGEEQKRLRQEMLNLHANAPSRISGDIPNAGATNQSPISTTAPGVSTAPGDEKK